MLFLVKNEFNLISTEERNYSIFVTNSLRLTIARLSVPCRYYQIRVKFGW